MLSCSCIISLSHSAALPTSPKSYKYVHTHMYIYHVNIMNRQMFLQPIFLGVDPFLEEADADANANFWEVLSSSVQGFFDLEEQDLTIFL